MKNSFTESGAIPVLVFMLFLLAVWGAVLVGFWKTQPRIDQCYTGASDPLIKVVKVLDYGVQWETLLPTKNPHAYARFYTTFDSFRKKFKRADCWARKD
jgi:hypothetical protein